MEEISVRPFLILSILGILAGIGYLLWGGLEENLVYFVTPTELFAKGGEAVGNPVRLGGVVAEPHYDGTILTFGLKDEANRVTVVTTKTPPQLFHEGMGVVVEGRLQTDGKFAAERLMVKHGNEYRPPAAGEIPQEIYQLLQQ